MAKDKISKDVLNSIPTAEKYRLGLDDELKLSCDRIYVNTVGLNEFGHINNQLTLLQKAQDVQQERFLRSLRPVPDVSDGTENMSLKDAFAYCPSRYAQTPNEVRAETLRQFSVLDDIVERSQSVEQPDVQPFEQPVEQPAVSE